ncbi:hypothetical protein [Pedobacter sp.]|uniref:hypothetical protein n=1 Tax=Pedobacter sp. TaxID=1411316 RepID=UPI0031D537CA
MKPMSIWAANAAAELQHIDTLALVSEPVGVSLSLGSDSLWLVKRWPDGGKIAFRTAFSPSGKLRITKMDQQGTKILVSLECSTLKYEVMAAIDEGQRLLRYTVSASPKISLNLPYWPKDMISLNQKGKTGARGTIHTQQRGTRSGILYFNQDRSGSVFYFQNLSALNRYCEDAQCSAGATVGGEWPEIGFSLPASNAPLKKDQTYIFSEALVNFSDHLPESPGEIAIDYLNRLSLTYLQLPRPKRFYLNWLDIVEKGLNDLIYHKGCWSFAAGHAYLNAYVADYKNPPEVMVQLAVLLPMIEYVNWKGETNHQLIEELKSGLENFYEEDMKTIVRWLPAMEENLDHSEEQKKTRIMDAWYLHHPLMNLARLSDHGDKMAHDLLFKSIGYAMHVAQTFKYKWPVFYQMDTLNVIKAETAEGAGGEKDVPGTYADLMLRMWKLTGEKRFFKEAERAAKELVGLSFDIFYQANNTAFSAGAMLRLYKETGNQKYLDLSYVCLAAIFDNVQLWECNYGHAKNFPTFFGIFPLRDAPYTAAYEEQEVYAALHDYLAEAEGIDILPSVRLLIAEFIRHTIGRLAYYYPTMLKSDMIATKSKTGEIDQRLWIALEDLHDGWEQSGEVGQEVYGAGIAFGVIPKQYRKVKDEHFTVFCDYPVASFRKVKKTLYITTGGDARLECRLIFLLDGRHPYTFNLDLGDEIPSPEPVKVTPELVEFSITGNLKAKVTWTKKGS